MGKIKFDQALQGTLDSDVLVETIEKVLKDNPDIDRAKLIVTCTKKLKGLTNAAQIAKVVKIKGYFE